MNLESKMQSELRNINTRTGFSNCILPVTNTMKIRNKMHEQFIVGSTLSFHLNPIAHTTKVKFNTVSEYECQVLPRFFIDDKRAIDPKSWQLNSNEKNYLDSINVINEKSILLEQDKVGLTEKKE